ncbi:MAG: 50S ribosomal protein L15 [Desulfurococcaceae archaeon]|nr:50S ribosomal protein L15 [Desulfurococcaceae archaeon]
MVVRREKKSRKLRGRTRTMGWGRIGQHRKSGSRGGFGAVGFHKHKWIWLIKHAPNWYGKHGFVSPRQLRGETKTINVGDLNELALQLLSQNRAVRENELIVIDTVEMGYDKVLGRGRVTIPLKVITKSISEKAKKKIEKQGGVVVLVENAK